MKNRLSTKLLFYIVLCSAFFTLLATAFQLYMDYRRDLAAVHESFHFIEKSYLPAIAASAWDMDEEHLRLQLQGALKLQDIEYLEIIETRTAGEVIIAAQGNPNSKKDIVHEFSLQYLNAPEGTIHIAKLRVTASLEGVHQRLWAKAWIILVSNAVQIFLASFFIFLIIQFLITRHITRMAQYTQELDLDKLDRELVLDRRTYEPSKPDELDELVTAFNGMRVKLAKDIEERKKAEESLRLHAAMMGNVAEGIYLIGLDDFLIKWTNEKFTRMFGYDPGEMVGKHVDIVNAPSERTPNETRISIVDVLKETGKWHGEVRNIKRDGTHFWCSANVSLFDHPEYGKVIVSVHTDITERKQAEEAVRESEERLALTLDASNSGIWDFNPQTFTDAHYNDTWFTMLGYEPDELPHTAETWTMLMHPEDLGQVQKKLQDHIEKKIEYSVEFRMKTKDGGYRWIHSVGKIVSWDDKGNPKRMTGIHVDINDLKQADEELEKHRDHLEEQVTERTEELKKSQQVLVNIVEDLNITTEELKNANEHLQELDRLKSMFIASMSHELRTPLNSIIGFTGIILQGMTGEINAEQRDQLQRVYGSAKHLLALINDVIDISKIEAGKFEVHLEECSLDGVVREAVSNLTPEMTNKGLDLEISLPQDTRLTTDRKRLLQCILNYLSNAVKFTEKGSISIATHEVDGMIEINVKDTGIGIKEEDVPRLFESFVRLDSPLRIKTTGTGLGLYLTRKIVTEMLGGEVFVDSKYGEGSTFILKIPKELT